MLIKQPSRRDVITYGGAVGVALAAHRRAHAQMLVPIVGANNPASGLTSWVTGQTLGTPRNNADISIGVKITVGASPITVVEVARWVISGNTQTHYVLWTNTAGALLTDGQVTVSTSGEPDGWKWGTLPNPIVLSASTSYFLFSTEANSGDQWYDDDTTITVTGAASDDFSGYTFNCVPGPCDTPNTFTAGRNFGPVNFKYHL